MRMVSRLVALTVPLTLLAVAPALPVASWAAEAVGACCLQNATCQDLPVSQCETLGGEFIGEATSCATTDCQAPLAAPLLSIFGVVGLIGALGGLGAYRLFVRRRG